MILYLTNKCECKSKCIYICNFLMDAFGVFRGRRIIPDIDSGKKERIAMTHQFGAVAWSTVCAGEQGLLDRKGVRS